MPTQPAGLLDAIPAAFKPIDILVNNAGHDIGGRTAFAKGSADDWASIVETNLIGLMRVTRAVLPGMVDRNTGDIVVMSSINALRIIPDMAPYSASKAGVHMLTETLRGELAETNIRVIELNPGLTKTNIILTRYRGDKEKEKGLLRPVQTGDGAGGCRTQHHVCDQRAAPCANCANRYPCR